MTTYRIREFWRAVKDFVPRALAGFEPVAARAFLSSLFAAFALLGIGSGELPAWAETTLAAAAVLIPSILGLIARSKVSPVGAVPEQLEDDEENEDDDLAPAESGESIAFATPLNDLSAGDSDDSPEPGDHRLGKPIEG